MDNNNVFGIDLEKEIVFAIHFAGSPRVVVYEGSFQLLEGGNFRVRTEGNDWIVGPLSSILFLVVKSKSVK